MYHQGSDIPSAETHSSLRHTSLYPRLDMQVQSAIINSHLIYANIIQVAAYNGVDLSTRVIYTPMLIRLDVTWNTFAYLTKTGVIFLVGALYFRVW